MRWLHSRFWLFFSVIVATFALDVRVALAALNYDIVYLRAPRKGDVTLTDWPEVFNPLKMEPGTHLMRLKANGAEELLFDGSAVGGDPAKAAVLDPVVSFDAKYVYFAYFPDVSPSGRNSQRNNVPKEGSDIYRIDLATKALKRLTTQQWRPPYAGVKWSSDRLQANASDENYLGYGIFNMAPCPLPGGKIMFVSNRHGFIPNKDYTFPNHRLYVMDENGNNIEQVGHLSIGSVMHPIILRDGRVVFSSYESQGLRDQRVWSLWSILPDGRYWEPMFGSFKVGSSMHFQTQMSDGRVAVVEYYNLNNEGFGSLFAFDAEHEGDPKFGSFNGQDSSNPKVRRGRWFFQPGHPEHLKPRFTQFRFSPPGLVSLTEFSHGEDNAADVPPNLPPSSTSRDGLFAGKVTHPSAAPNNDVLLVYSPGPVNNLNRPITTPRIQGQIRILRGGVPVDDPNALELIKSDPAYNYQMPKAVVPYREIYGVNEPAKYDWTPNRGTLHVELPEGTPFGLIGTSTFYRRDSKPGNFEFMSFPQDYDRWDRFNTAENDDNPNWFNQGADAGKYTNDDIYAVRIVGMEGVVHRSYGPNAGKAFNAFHGNERLRVLGEIPLKKNDQGGNVIRDSDGNPDTSFLAKIPADTAFTFQTLDRRGMVLNMSQTWHQVRAGEMRVDCGGCHAHSQKGMKFETTAASKTGYAIEDLTKRTPVMKLNAAGDALFEYLANNKRVLDVEFHRDIKPILQAKCASCHTGTSPPKGLKLDDNTIVRGFDNTYNRLADDTQAAYGIKPVINGQAWRGSNASRYVRKFQSRRSLLIWMIFGERLDGWTNADHPTETTPGDRNTLPAGVDPNAADLDYVDGLNPKHSTLLTPDEKLKFVRWIDLGAPVDSLDTNVRPYGWFNDEEVPVLTLSDPPAYDAGATISRIRFGAFDNYSGLDRTALSVKADFAIDGVPAGSELIGRFSEADHVWTMNLNSPMSRPTSGVITVRAKDFRGNEAVIERTLIAAAPQLNALLDVDASSGATKYAADHDGLMILRFLLGIRGDAITAGIIAPTATRSAQAIETHLTSIAAQLNVSQQPGIAKATTDGFMILRYMLGMRGTNLMPGLNATQAAPIEARIQALMP
jgi:Hydrazine synthase alpha subunit middle domain